MKYAPAVGDVGVIGTLEFVTTNPLGSCGFFDASVTANGYASAADNVVSVNLRFCCPVVPAGLNPGDSVTANILQGNDGPYAGNIQAL
jgi:hypothetical protein